MSRLSPTDAPELEPSAAPRRRRHDEEDGPDEPTPAPARPNKKQKPPPQPKQNTAVYVTGLPLDATVDEVHEVFSRKCGVIAEEIDSGAPRIKMYTNPDGSFKGDALVVFFKAPSVQMAIQLLDDSYFRYTINGTTTGRIRVQEADSSFKKVHYDQEGAADEKTQAKKPQKSSKDRQKIIKKTQKLEAKLADWDDDDPYTAPGQAVSKWDKMVILKHMFTLRELEEDPTALLDIKEDVRDECEKLGTVTNVVLFDEEEDGIVTVKFKEVEAVDACIKLMHGRAFDGRTVEAYRATGKEKFKMSKQEQNGDESD